MWSLGALLLFSSISIKNTLAYSSLAELESDSKLLSRQRRFLIPNVTSDWTFTVKFTLVFPLEGLDTSLTGSVPFSFDFNPSRYVNNTFLFNLKKSCRGVLLWANTERAQPFKPFLSKGWYCHVLGVSTGPQKDTGFLSFSHNVHQHYLHHGQRTPRERFFSKIPKFWAWTDKLGRKFLGHLGYFRTIYQHPFW